MADFFATSGADNFAGTANADNFVVNHAADIQAGDAFTGGDGTDTLWVTLDMTDPGGNDVDMPGNLDFSSMVLSSLEILSFNYMKMPMPGQATFSSSQFGAGLSNSLEVRGAWGDQDITVNLVSGDSSFDASGWTFPSNGTLNGTSGGLPMGTAIYVWGGYVYGGAGATGMFAGQSVGGTDTIHINGSAGANTIAGTIKDDMIDGGDGNDTVVFAGNWADYTISLDAGVFTLTSAATGTDKVSNTELFQFANGTYSAANLLNGNLDVTPPDVPVIEAWTDTTDPILMNGANPLWRISGQAEPGAIIKLYTVTLAADGTVTARTQISTYTQGTPNPTTGAPTIVVGPDFVVADANGNWEFQSNLTEHGDRRVQATATDASDNVSDYSLVAIQGGHHTTTMSFTDPSAFSGISKIDGYHQDTGPDILKFTTATTVTDADFAKIHDIESVQLTGASTITLGANALAAGIGGEITPALGNGGIITGDGNTSITDTNARALNVNASAMLAGTTLTLAGTASYNVTGSDAGTTIVAAGGDDTLTGGTGADALKGGAGANTLLGGAGDDSLYANTGVETLSGGEDNDSLIVNRQAHINAGDVFDGGNGTDVLWLTKGMMDIDMPGDLDFTGTTLTSIEVLSFNYMKMLMPGSATFTSDQFGAGLSNTLEVRGAWGDQDITVNLVSGNSSFDASGWTFATLGGSTTGETSGMPSGTATAVWGPYWNLNTTGMNQNQPVGGTDSIHLTGSAGDNTIKGSSQNDIVDGGDGTDTVVFSGAWADYTISKNGNTFTFAGGPGGTDEVTNVENFQFSNVTVAAADLLNVAPTDISLTGSNIADNAAANTVVGSLSVTDANAALGDTASYVLTDNAGGRFAISGGNIVVASNAVLAFGSYDVTVQAEDAGGLTYSEMFTITVDDATAPSVAITAGPAAGINTNITDATFSWTGNDGAGSGVDHYEYSTDGGGTWTSTTDTSVTLAGLIDGANSFRVRAIDVANNPGLAASREWTVNTSVPYMGTAAIDIFEGAGGDEDFIFNRQAYVNAGDDIDGGGGIDTVWAAEGMMDYEENFDFSAVVFRNMEALAFNYMPMPMPGQVIFSSTQFGAGLLSDDLMIYGAWDDQKITVNLADGDSSFDASAWQFANAGATSGTQSAVWGKYTYTGGGMFSGQEVGGTDTILLVGSAGNNRIAGTSVADVIYGGAGSDTMAGGSGNDTYYVDRSTDLVTEAANAGTDVVYASSTHTMRSNVENLVLLGTSNFAGTGNGLSNAISGNAGANTLSGAAGNDVLKGGAGTDTLLGSVGNDKLTGGLGMDKLTGGSGLDRFIYTATSESSGSAVDRIYDLRAGDKIDVHLIDANSGAGGNQAFVLDAFGDRSFDIGHIRQTKSGANLILDFNTDADSAAEMRIILMNHGTVKASDFIL